MLDFMLQPKGSYFSLKNSKNYYIFRRNPEMKYLFPTAFQSSRALMWPVETSRTSTAENYTDGDGIPG